MSSVISDQELFDGILRHQMYLNKYSSYVRNRMQQILNQTESRISNLIKSSLGSSNGLNTPKDWTKLQELLESITTIRTMAWKEVSTVWLSEMVQLASNEPAFMSNLIQSSLPVFISPIIPEPRLLKSIALSRPFQGRVLKDWAQKMQYDDLARISNVIQLGMVAGEGNVQIARRVIGTGTLNGVDGVTEQTRGSVERLVRTATNYIANNARNEFFKENETIFDMQEYVATLDIRTTPLCAGLDGQLFPLGKAPVPPLHFGCRSVLIPHFNVEEIGKRPMKPFTEKQLLREYSELNGFTVTKRDNLPRGHKTSFDKFSRERIRELTGRVDSNVKYDEFLKRQSIAFQEEFLGKTKAKLFRDGNLPLKNFVDKNGKTYSLRELAIREEKAFIAAGLDPAQYK